MKAKIVKKGTWLYDGLIEKPVDIVAMGFDWWYELAKADEQLEEGEKPEPLGKDGYLYYVRFQNAGEAELPTWVDSAGYGNLEEAIKEAEAKIQGAIKWC